MFILCVVSLVILAFRYTTRTECPDFNVIIGNDTPQVNEPVQFRVGIKASKYYWDFGDGKTQQERIASVSHVFKNPGKHTISVLVDNNCERIIDVFVVPQPVVKYISIQPPIVAPSQAFVGEQVVFEDTSSTATSWEWQFEGDGKVHSRVQRPTYIYNTSGERFVILKVNGRVDREVTHRILIKNKIEKSEEDISGSKKGPKIKVITIPEKPSTEPIDEQQSKEPQTEEKPKEEPVKMAPIITNDQLSDMLKQVAEGKKQAGDFKEFLCDNLDIAVMYEKKPTTFSAMCKSLEKIRNRRVKKIHVLPYRNGKTNCIEQMQVTVEKTLL